MSTPENPEEITESLEDESRLEQLMQSIFEQAMQESINEFARRHPKGSRFAKKAKRNPEKAIASRKFTRETRYAVRMATLTQQTDLETDEEEMLAEIKSEILARYMQAVAKQPEKKSKVMRRAELLSIAMHTAPVLGAIDYHDLRRDAADVITAQFRALRRTLHNLTEGNVEFDFSLDKLFDKDPEEMDEAEQEEWVKNVQDLIIKRPDLAREMIEDRKLDLDKFLAEHGKGFHGRFFIETEHLRGTSAEDTLESKRYMQALYKAAKAEMKRIAGGRCDGPDASQPWDCLSDKSGLKRHEEYKLLDRIVQTYGEDQTWAPNYVGDLVRRKYGNCSARAKLNLAVVKDLNWGHIKEVKLQAMGLHIRVVIKMSDKNWYAMDGKLRRLPAADITGTALLDENMYIKRYLKQAPEVKYLDENKDMNYRKSLEAMIIGALLSGTDDYLTGGEIRKQLRSVRDLQWIEEEEKKESEPIEVTLDTTPYNPEGREASEEISEGMAPRQEEEEEEPEYIIPKRDLFDARMTGDINLSDRNLKDLEQLRGVEVTELSIGNTDIADLSPLEGSPLEVIWMYNTKVTDISALAGKPIRLAFLRDTGISDISPLKSAPLEHIDITRTEVSDISVLADKPIERARLGFTKVTDLSPLRGKAITELELNGWDINEETIEIIKTMPIKKLNLRGAKIDDLSVFEDMDIEAIDLADVDIQDFSSLANWRSLKAIHVDSVQLKNEQLKKICEAKNIIVFHHGTLATSYQSRTVRNNHHNGGFHILIDYFGEYMMP